MKVAILGTGLIGGSIGLAIKAADRQVEVVAYDRDPDSATAAVDRGAADAAATTIEAAVAGADIVFIATPVGAILEVARGAISAMKPGSVLTDVGSTKSRVVVEVERLPNAGVVFIGGHPMAGTEEQGIMSSSAELFDGAWWILTPSERVAPAEYRRLHTLLTALRARVMALDATEHDELMAVISHVPQLVATAMMNLAAERGREHGGLLALAAGGFRDVTRIAASNPEIWVDICAENAPAITGTLGRLIERLQQAADLLERKDDAALRAELTRAREARLALPGKAVVGELYDVRVPVPDRPGLLALVTTTIGNIGVNIEDLQIVHGTDGDRGTLHLSIAGRVDAGKVEGALVAAGLEAKAIPR